MPKEITAACWRHQAGGRQLLLTVFLALCPAQVSRNELIVEKLSCQLFRSESRKDRKTTVGMENRSITKAAVPNRAEFASHSFTLPKALGLVDSGMSNHKHQYTQGDSSCDQIGVGRLNGTFRSINHNGFVS